MNDGILSAIGNTPLVRLTKVIKDAPFDLYAKLEALNPGGSMKDRPALAIIKHGLATDKIDHDTVIIESSSGNMGIGLAQVCAYYGLRFICVIDPKTTFQNIRLLKLYGAEIDMVTDPDPTTGEFLQARISRVQTLLRTIDNSFWPNQYANLNNPRAHYQTMEEILCALDGKLDGVFCATSTCGTLRGCADYIRRRNLKTKVFAVDAIGSVIFGGPRCKRLIPGHGAAIRPALYEDSLADHSIQVTDLDCVIGCRRLLKEEGILAGGSSGALVAAVEQVQHEIPPRATYVMILPDRGERYLDTIYSDEWVREHFGEVSHLWQTAEMAKACVTMTY